MTDLATDLYGLPPDLQAVSNAILSQESGNNPNSPTSVDGAVGRAQITPATFKQYAQPGEDINNPDDNLAVHNRIIADLAQKSGNDPARIAAGYFSGPGNIAPADAATPYKADRADGNGKKVSAYVSDVVKRLNPVGTANAEEVAKPVGADDLAADLYGNAAAPSQPESIIQKRGQQGWDAINAYQQGKQTLPETALQVLGKAGARTISDYTGSALNALYHGITTPNVRQEISGLGDTVLGRGAKDLAQQASGAYGDFAQANPRAARNIESVGDLASVLPLGGKAVSATGQGLEAAAPAVGLVAKDLLTKIPSAVTADAIKAASSANYQAMRDAGAELNRSGISKITYNIGKDLANSGLMNDSLHGDTLSVVKDLNADAQSGSLTLEKLDQYRQLLGQVVKKNTSKIDGANPDAFKANVAIHALDDAVNGLGKEHLINGTPEAIQTLNKARNLWSAGSKMETVQNIIENSNLAKNPLSARQTAFANLAKSLNKNSRGWSADEVSSIKKAAKSGLVTDALGLLGSRLGPLIAGGVGLAGGPIAGGAAFTADYALSSTARAAANKIQMGRANKVLQTIGQRPSIQAALPRNNQLTILQRFAK